MKKIRLHNLRVKRISTDKLYFLLYIFWLWLFPSLSSRCQQIITKFVVRQETIPTIPSCSQASALIRALPVNQPQPVPALFSLSLSPSSPARLLFSPTTPFSFLVTKLQTTWLFREPGRGKFSKYLIVKGQQEKNEMAAVDHQVVRWQLEPARQSLQSTKTELKNM